MKCSVNGDVYDEHFIEEHLGCSNLQHATGWEATPIESSDTTAIFLPTRHAAVKTSRYQPYTHTQHLGTFKLPANGRLKRCMRQL